MLIPLHTFNPKALEGARVALHFVDIHGNSEPTPSLRVEWCADMMVRVNLDTLGSRHPYIRFDIGERAADVFWELAIDPTDPDTTRLIDRRIAEADETPHDFPIIAAVLRVLVLNGSAKFQMYALREDGSWSSWKVIHDCLEGLDIVAANLPEARQKLLYTLYPPVAACS